jgi:hypothetical protein
VRTILNEPGRTAGGCVRSLGIEVTDDWVTIRGNAPSYDAKQLALLAVQETLGVALRPRIALEIDVTARDQRAAEGRDKRQRAGLAWFGVASGHGSSLREPASPLEGVMDEKRYRVRLGDHHQHLGIPLTIAEETAAWLAGSTSKCKSSKKCRCH